MSIEPKIEKTSDVTDDERNADRPGSTAEVAKDLARPDTRGQANGKEEAATLFPENEAKDFRTRWTDIQTGFVVEPRRAVIQAEALVAETIKRLAHGFAAAASR